MRIAIREQLLSLILLASLISLAVLSIAVWISNYNFVLGIRGSRLTLTASLKAAQLASNLQIMQTAAGFLSIRSSTQRALQRYSEDGNDTYANWDNAISDMQSALGGDTSTGRNFLLQVVVYGPNASGPAGNAGLMNITAADISLTLPYVCPGGAQAYLGMTPSDCGGYSYGYPPNLYPNLTYSQAPYNATFNIQQANYDGVVLGPGSTLMMGPWTLNSSVALVSMTLPIVNSSVPLVVLGWITIVMDSSLINQVFTSTEGLGNTGETLILGPTSNTNLFPPDIPYTTNQGHPPQDFQVQYVVPLNASDAKRHPDHVTGSPNLPFNAKDYPVVYEAITKNTNSTDGSGSSIRAVNEAGKQVSVGFATTSAKYVDWVVLVEQARSEVWQPINHLRDIILACVFGCAGFMAIVAFPLAHWASLPIRRLREATRKSIEPPGSTPSRSSMGSYDVLSVSHVNGSVEPSPGPDAMLAKKEGMMNMVGNWRQKKHEEREARREQRRRRQFRIPGKVKERKHIIKDELTDLTSTFNEMTDELMGQYERLEDRVQQRTAELELSKQAAEAANESKTLFIANISHELKTPLNGILGMSAVAMQEEDPVRLKRSLGIIYKSGDLLLNLLTDLLTFSKNQVGQHISLDEKEFRLRDISSQTLAIFDKQAKEGQIDLKVQWEGIYNLPVDNDSPERTDNGPAGTGRMKDMILWGDLQRVMQVVINLVSNACKFTPSGGKVVLTVRCLPDLPDISSRKGSFASRQSKQSKQSHQISSRHKGSDATLASVKFDTANCINPKERPGGIIRMPTRDREFSPPPGKYLDFEFEVADTGPGIPEDLQSKIFEPFVQGDLGLSKKFGGTGLGLSICSQLATLMRGTVRVSSTEGVGSTFTLKIPLRHLKTRADSSASSQVETSQDAGAQRSSSTESGTRTPARHSRHLADGLDTSVAPSNNAGPGTPSVDAKPRLVGLSQPFFAPSQPMESPGSQSAAIEKMTAEAGRGDKIRVLVAEDNTVNQEVVLRMLKLEDIYDVTVAKDGQEALDMVKASMAGRSEERKQFNLIFMDVQMPNLDGLQSTRLIREIGYQQPIVALTAFAEESNIKDCYESGMNYFLSKPIRRPQLKKVLNQYCAPIPEENEESQSPPLEKNGARPESGNTTIVVLNQTSEPNSSGRANGHKSEDERPRGRPTEISRTVNRTESPVSPMSP